MLGKREIQHHQSKSLWNYTLSPGWTDDEVFVLKLALQKFGVGRWKKIIQSECLPGKGIGQIYLQTQRIMGQQSLGGFMGLHVDIEKVFMSNMKKKNALRKNNCIINTGDNPTKEERDRKTRENKLMFGLSKDYVKQIKLPRSNTSQFKHVIMLEEINSGKFSTIERIHHLEELKKAVDFKLQLLADRGADEYRSNFKNKGVMAPLKIDYYSSSHAQLEQTEPVIISLKKIKDGTYNVL